jgi:hypothetical protein
LLIKEENVEQALQVLEQAGHYIERYSEIRKD